MLVITVMIAGGIAELRVDGDVVNQSADELLRECQKQVGAGKHLRVDLKGVAHLDRAGVEKLKDLACNGTELLNASERLRSLLGDGVNSDSSEARQPRTSDVVTRTLL